MTKNDMLEKAHYIFTAGKLIHDKIYQTGAQYFNYGKGAEETVELSLPQKNMIMIIRRQGKVTITDLAQQLGVSPPSVSAMVDRLVEKKIVTREHGIEDRRKVAVRISDDAIAMMEGFEKNILGFFVDLVEKVGAETTEQWCQVLKRVEAALEPSTDKDRME